MPYEPTHASFFSGVGGTDLGLEAAGWRTVSFSEIDPYASAVLAERWPGIPNLGDIVRLSEHRDRDGDGRDGQLAESGGLVDPWQSATLWSGGFPCQDLSVAGKRAGFAGERSVLAFAFLDLVERHRPPAVLLENVPGLLSSHGGKDFGTLLGRLGQLGYGWAYRILDARYFGVPQRRRRVFICALDLERGLSAERAAAVLSVGTRCDRHPATGIPKGPGAASGVGGPAGDEHHNPRGDGGDNLVRSSSDPGGVRAPDGLAGRLDDLAPTLRVGPARPQDGGPGDTVPVVVSETGKGWWTESEQSSALRSQGGGTLHHAVIGGHAVSDDPLLPLGLDSHRYRCCGNGVVAPVAEWIGRQLLAVLR